MKLESLKFLGKKQETLIIFIKILCFLHKKVHIFNTAPA